GYCLGYLLTNCSMALRFPARYPRQYPEPESYMHLFSKNIRVKEVGVRMFERTTGVSSINLIKGVNYMVSVSLAILA
ncbi:glycosyltransferase family 2 protein, partial [Lactococcus lactis]